MKKYNVTLSNESCIFDTCENIATVEEAVAFASGRGSVYQVFIDTGKEDTIVASHYTDINSFSIYNGMDYIFYSADDFIRYVKKYL